MGITLCFPHLDNPWNTAALELKKKMLAENTRGEYQLLYITGTQKEDVYPAWNYLFSIAKYPLILWDNSDLLYAKDWDVLLRKYADEAEWLSLRVVECGQIGVAASNIEHDFGITAETFRRDEFEAWCKEDAKTRPEIEDGWSWYSPSVFKKDWFLATGGFPTKEPFPHPNDSLWKESLPKDTRYKVVNSYAYHLQFAGENQGTKPPRV